MLISKQISKSPTKDKPKPKTKERAERERSLRENEATVQKLFVRWWEQKGKGSTDRRQSRRDRTEYTHQQKEEDVCDWGLFAKKSWQTCHQTSPRKWSSVLPKSQPQQLGIRWSSKRDPCDALPLYCWDESRKTWQSAKGKRLLIKNQTNEPTNEPINQPTKRMCAP